MTEEEWLKCTEPMRMLEFLREKTSDRKFRLFAVACCRRVWHLVSDEECKRATEVAERFADNLATKNELRVARKRAMRVKVATRSEDSARALAVSTSFKSAYGAAYSGYLNGVYALATVSFVGNYPANRSAFEEFIKVRDEGLRGACSLIREVWTNPFRPVTLDPSWLTPTVAALAQSIYTSRSFDQMPVLADELEKSGCDNAKILEHCRGTCVHVKGCWAIDFLLAKE